MYPAWQVPTPGDSEWHQAGTPRALARSRQLPRQGFYANATCQAGSTQGDPDLTGKQLGPGLRFPPEPLPASPEMPSKSLALTQEGEGRWLQRGGGLRGSTGEETLTSWNTNDSKVGPRQPEWMAQLVSLGSEGAEGPSNESVWPPGP